MSALAEALGNKTPAHVFHHTSSDGAEKVYQVRLVTQAVKVAVEKRLYDRAREIVRDEKPDLTPEEYESRCRALARDYQLGEYAMESERGQAYLKSRAGVIHLAALLFQCDEMEMVRLFGERQADVGTLLQLVLRESFGDVKPPPFNGEAGEPEKNAETAADAPAAASLLW